MSKRLTYLPELDGLRGFAILLVVFYHAKLAGFGGGFIGVDIFFVLSGYLVTFGLYQELVSTKTINLGEFFQRRIKRLLPVFFFVILITLAIGYFVLIPIAGEQQALGRSAIASSLFLSNLYFIFNTGGYFDEPTELQPLLHTWSLSVEAQFYLI
jgi:peptidoglycan/LPS O-acetylase OafA/YrhL